MSYNERTPFTCKECGFVLSDDHQSPCPECGKTGRSIKMTFFERIHVTDTINKVVITWKKHPILKAICWVFAFLSLIVGLFFSEKIAFVLSLILFCFERILSHYSEKTPNVKNF